MAFDTSVAAAISDLKNKIDSALDGTPGGFEKAAVFAAQLARFTTSSTTGSVNGAYPSINGSINSGGSAQIAATANTNRKAMEIQNTSAENLSFRFDAVASATAGFILLPGQSWQNPPGFYPSGALSVWGATTGQTFVTAQG